MKSGDAKPKSAKPGPRPAHTSTDCWDPGMRSLQVGHSLRFQVHMLERRGEEVLTLLQCNRSSAESNVATRTIHSGEVDRLR